VAIRLDGSGSLFPAITSHIVYTGLLSNNESGLLKCLPKRDKPRPTFDTSRRSPGATSRSKRISGTGLTKRAAAAASVTTLRAIARQGLGAGANNAAAVGAADGCQALRVSIERALGDDAADGIASAPGMITGGRLHSLRPRDTSRTAPKAAITDTAALFAAQAEPRVQGNVARVRGYGEGVRTDRASMGAVAFVAMLAPRRNRPRRSVGY
jgi:hypothetical protein